MSVTQTLDSIMLKVKVLLARAEHPNTPPPEAEMSRVQAEKLMTKYRVSAWEAQEAGEVVLTPISRTVRVCRSDNEFRNSYWLLACYVSMHAGVRSAQAWGYDEDGFRTIEMTIVGYEEDVRYVEMLMAGIMVAFARRLEPSFDPMESPEANAFRMRKGGMERHRIGVALFGPSDTVNEMKGKNRKVTALIKAGAKQAGESADDLLGRSVNIKTFRAFYADAFTSTIYSRLHALRLGNGLNGTALVLSNRKESIDEAFYALFPHYRPAAAAAALEGASDTECPACKKAKSGHCRQHPKGRAYKGSEAYSEAGVRHGRAAAREVNLGGSSSQAIG